MRRTCPTMAFAALLSASAAANAAVVADFVADFSTTSNPTGAWSYGGTTTLGGAFFLSSHTTTYGPGNEVTAWSPVGTF